jgi:hypothetical protein
MGPAGICDSWLQCNIQVACQLESKKMLQYFNQLLDRLRNIEFGFTTNFLALRLKISRRPQMPNFASPDFFRTSGARS